MFKGFSTDSITVPACNKHNNLKSISDQDVVAAFLLPFYVEKSHVEPEVKRAISEAYPSFERAKKRVFAMSPIAGYPHLPKLSYLSGDMEFWVKQLTAGLVWNATHKFDETIDWNNAILYSPHWIPSSPTPMPPEVFIELISNHKEFNVAVDSLDWKNGWSAQPRPYPQNIFRFQLYFEMNTVNFRHIFYNRYEWHISVSPSEDTLIKLKKKVSGVNGSKS